MARGQTFASGDRFAFKALAASELGRKSHGGRGAAQQHAYRQCAALNIRKGAEKLFLPVSE
jgi:hypothetical protein